MTNTCDCGNPITTKNTRGWYHNKCMNCMQDDANSVTRHVDNCTDPECVVCVHYELEQEGFGTMTTQ